jgi:hypothetical protein
MDNLLERLRHVLSGKYNGSMTRREMARALGRRGGRVRAVRLTAEDKARIAALGGQARARSLRAARRLVENLQYAAALRELRGPRPVARLSTFQGRLPGIYPAGR